MPSHSYDQPDGFATVNHTYTPIVGTCPASYEVQEVNKVRRGDYKGANTPDYFAKVRSGALLPLNSYTRFDRSEDRPHGIYGGTYRKPLTGDPTKSYDYEVNSIRSVSGAIQSVEQATSVATEMAADIDIAALHQSAMAACLPSLDALTFMVESRDTIDMLKNARSDAKRLILEAKRGGKHTVKAASDAWLAWRYGWQTLGMDIEAAVEAFNAPLRDEIVEGRAGESVKQTLTSNSPFVGYYVSHDYETTLSRDLSVRVNACAKMSARTLNVLVSPAVTGWETIPYSFVADWFVSVGDAIAAWVVLASAESTYSSIGYKLEEIGQSTVSNVSNGIGAYATNPRASGTTLSSATLKLRAPLGNPSLIPRIRVELTSRRLLDAGALFAKRIF